MIILPLISLLAGIASAAPGDMPLAPVISRCTKNNTVALTFSGGPSGHFRKVVDILEEHNVKGTFFLNGYEDGTCIFDRGPAEDLVYAFRKQHQIGESGWKLQDLTLLQDNRAINDQFFNTESSIRAIIGKTPWFVRPPFGAVDDKVAQEVANRRSGQAIVLWDFESQDLTATPEEQMKLYEELVAGRPPSALALFHEFTDSIFTVLPFAINAFKKAGYNIVTVAECLENSERSMYTVLNNEGGLGIRDDACWTCEGYKVLHASCYKWDNSTT